MGRGAAAGAGSGAASPTTTMSRPADCSIRCGTCADRSITTLVITGCALFNATRTRMMRGSALFVTAGTFDRTPTKSMKILGGPSTVPIVGAGSGPSAAIVTTAAPVADVAVTDVIVIESRWPAARAGSAIDVTQIARTRKPFRTIFQPKAIAVRIASPEVGNALLLWTFSLL